MLKLPVVILKSDVDKVEILSLWLAITDSEEF